MTIKTTKAPWNGNVPGFKTIAGKKFSLSSGPLTKAEAMYHAQFYRTAYFVRTFKIGRQWYTYMMRKK